MMQRAGRNGLAGAEGEPKQTDTSAADSTASSLHSSRNPSYVCRNKPQRTPTKALHAAQKKTEEGKEGMGPRGEAWTEKEMRR